MNETMTREDLREDPLVFWHIITRERAAAALRREEALKRTGGELRIFIREARRITPMERAAIRRRERRAAAARTAERILQAATNAGLVLIIVALIFALGFVAGSKAARAEAQAPEAAVGVAEGGGGK